jgi:hypothetical protein
MLAASIKTVRVEVAVRPALSVATSAVSRISQGWGSNFFLFHDRATLGASDPLSADWVTGKGERVRLTD